MKLDQVEGKDAIKWIVCAGGAAVALAVILFWTDTSYMSGSTARDRAHNAQMRELRAAQASVPGDVTDSRQTIPLDIEHMPGHQADASAHPAEHNHAGH